MTSPDKQSLQNKHSKLLSPKRGIGKDKGGGRAQKQAVKTSLRGRKKTLEASMRVVPKVPHAVVQREREREREREYIDR